MRAGTCGGPRRVRARPTTSREPPIRPLRLLLLAAASTVAAALSASPALAVPHSSARGLGSRHVCGTPAAGDVACRSLVVTNPDGSVFDGGPSPATTAPPAGYGPAELRSAYSLPAPSTSSTSPGTGQTVAIVDAYDDPNAESDLATYRQTFGLGACTSTSGCFRKVNQNGGSTPPRANGSWAQEISLDVDMVSAICPSCHILLVEASSSGGTALDVAENTAARLGATEISNSWGTSAEYSGETSEDSTYFNHPGIAITVASGDNGYNNFGFPAASAHVTAVGGTSLTRAAGTARGWSETAWSGSGSGCSLYIPKPTWQPAVSGCPSNRAVADTSAVADPNTGVAVYDTYHTSGWTVFGGTSVASPITAAVYALAGNASGLTGAQSAYGNAAAFWDVSSGASKGCNVTGNLCTAVAAYDGPTGLGTPDGLGGF